MILYLSLPRDHALMWLLNAGFTAGLLIMHPILLLLFFITDGDSESKATRMWSLQVSRDSWCGDKSTCSSLLLCATV